IRQSPHIDQNIRVCNGADVWLEVAEHPRRRMPDIRSYRTPPSHLPDDPWNEKNSRSGHPLERFRPRHLVFVGVDEKTRDVAQYPPVGEPLEPWETIALVATSGAVATERCATSNKSAMPTLTTLPLSSALETLRAKGFPNASVVPAKGSAETLA